MSRRAGNPTDFESFLTWEALVDVLSYDPAYGEFRWLGTFDTKEEAVLARARFDNEHIGEFARSDTSFREAPVVARLGQVKEK
jgi:hypothetical protein